LTIGGVFSFSLPNPETLNNLESQIQPEIEMIFPHPETGNPVQVSYEIIRRAVSITFHWYYDHLYPDGRIERLEVPNSHRLTTCAQYLDEIRSAGYKIEATYGDFDFTPYKPDSPNLIFVVRKI
jgi:hypothetical protein